VAAISASQPANQQSTDKQSGRVQPQDHPGHFMITEVRKYEVLEFFIKFLLMYLFTCGLFGGILTALDLRFSQRSV
jgi:hypothetical protein